MRLLLPNRHPGSLSIASRITVGVVCERSLCYKTHLSKDLVSNEAMHKRGRSQGLQVHGSGARQRTRLTDDRI